MKKIFIVILALMLIGVSCAKSAEDEPVKQDKIEGTKEEIATAYLQDFKAQNYSNMYQLYEATDEMKSATSESVYKQIYDSVTSTFGKLLEYGEVTSSEEDGYTIVSRVAVYEKSSVSLNVVFDSEGKLAGFNYTQVEGEESLEDIAKRYITLMSEGKYESMISDVNHSQVMLDNVNPSIYEAIWITLVDTYGQFTGMEEVHSTVEGEYTIVAVHSSFENQNVTLNVVFDSMNMVTGFNYTPENDLKKGDFTEEEISFDSAYGPLGGTLTIPSGDGPFPCVILVHGSGPNDRDETILANKPFRDMAYMLAGAGIASYRYDKVTNIYGSEIDNDSFTIEDEVVNDVITAFEVIKDHEMVDSEMIYILGHSLGGYMIPWLSAETPGAAGYIMVAAPSSPLQSLIPMQYEYIFGLDGEITEAENETLIQLKETKDMIDKITESEDFEPPYNLGISKSYWLSLSEYDPVAMATEIGKPLMVASGGMDYQVPLEEYEVWQNVLDGMYNVTLAFYDDLSHLMIRSEGIPSPDMYNIPGHVDSDFIDDISRFIYTE